MMLTFYDTHAHLDEDAFDEDRDSLLSSFSSNGVLGAVNMGASPRNLRRSMELAAEYPFLYAGAGIHPDHVGEMNDDLMQELYEDIRSEKCVCVGEIGLDYHWDVESHDLQKKWFAAQMHLAIETGMPINVHSRDAAQDTFDLIRKEHAGTTGGIIHCYSGSVEMAQEYVKLGYHLGIGGVVTFKNAKTLKNVVARVPLEALVTETDCPYLAPSPHRGERNSSLYIPLVIGEIARIRGLDVEETARVLRENARKVYPRLAGFAEKECE